MIPVTLGPYFLQWETHVFTWAAGKTWWEVGDPVGSADGIEMKQFFGAVAFRVTRRRQVMPKWRIFVRNGDARQAKLVLEPAWNEEDGQNGEDKYGDD